MMFCFELWIYESYLVELMHAGKALMLIKASFSNVVNVLLDWDVDQNDDLCSWRGVLCDNISTTVVALYVISFRLVHTLLNLCVLVLFNFTGMVA